MGPSGSGKSTLMHCLAGLDRLTSGQVFLGDVELSSLSGTELTLLRRDVVGFVFQSFNLLPTLSAGENITLPMLLAGRRPDLLWLEAHGPQLRRRGPAPGPRHRHRPAPAGTSAWGTWRPGRSSCARAGRPARRR
jgi:putative ABC transport system ATP-binding protein